MEKEEESKFCFNQQFLNKFWITVMFIHNEFYEELFLVIFFYNHPFSSIWSKLSVCIVFRLIQREIKRLTAISRSIQ